jgi:hypothetical protein
MKVWITKYALTKGIIVAEAEKCNAGWLAKSAMVEWRGGMNGIEFFHGRDWHMTLEGALVRVKQMIDVKRKSLAKQAAKLEEFARSDLATKVSTVEEAMR